MKTFIIQITAPDGTITNHVGPFPSEEVADSYCATVLEPKLQGCKFLITELAEPTILAAQLNPDDMAYHPHIEIKDQKREDVYKGSPFLNGGAS